MKFTLEIEMGNEAMQTTADIGRALIKYGQRFRNNESDGPVIRDGGKIMDLNGNSVGKWEIVDDAPAEDEGDDSDDPTSVEYTAHHADCRAVDVAIRKQETERIPLGAHTLKILSLHDAQAVCTGGDWSFTAPGARTREQIEEHYSMHTTYVQMRQAKADQAPAERHSETGPDGKYPAHT